jgi:hypothetical protein
MYKDHITIFQTGPDVNLETESKEARSLQSALDAGLAMDIVPDLDVELPDPVLFVNSAFTADGLLAALANKQFDPKVKGTIHASSL